MNVNKAWLEDRLMLFISTLERCRDLTAVQEDKKLFERDIDTAKEWIELLSKSVNGKEVVDIILAPYTAKHFGDYWKQDPWGSLEMEALQNLRTAVKDYWR